MASSYEPRRGNGLAGFLAWASLLLVLLGAAFTMYGRFTALEARQDESETDRQEIIQRLDRIEQLLSGRGQ